VIGLEDAITDKAQPPGLMNHTAQCKVFIFEQNRNPVVEQTREVFFDQSMVCARHAARRIDL
jgi:predicted ATPase